MTSGLVKQVRQHSMNYGLIFGAIVAGMWFVFVFSSLTVALIGALIDSILGVFVGYLNGMLMLHLYSELRLNQEELRIRERMTYSSAIFTFAVSFILFVPGTQYVFGDSNCSPYRAFRWQTARMPSLQNPCDL